MILPAIRKLLLPLLPLTFCAAQAQSPAPLPPLLHPQGEFIFQPGSTSFPESHASTVVVLRDGSLMAAWFGGTKERNPDVAIWGAHYKDGVWSKPVELEREPGIASWNPVLFHTRDGRLWLYYKVGTSPGTWWGGRRFSTDEGTTWSAKERLPDGILGPIRAKPLVLPDGTVVAGSSVEKPGSWTAWIERSTDNSQTFSTFGPITISRELDAATPPAPDPPPGAPGWAADKGPRKYEGIIQPSVLALDNAGHLRMYARSRTLASWVAVADSTDYGKTWTQARYLHVPQNNSGLDVVRLRDGRIVMIFNDTTVGRTPLDLAISTDGEHFRTFAVLEDTVGQYSYPAIVQGADGALEMTYTWKRKTIKHVHLPLAEVPQR